MENASKALLMAGAVLIALVIIALLIRTFTTLSSFQNAKLSEEEQEKIIAFNEQYTKYEGQYVYGTEVLTLQNRYNNDKKVEVLLTSGSESPTEEDNKYNKTADGQYSNQTRYYKCIRVEYDATGRVNKITFQQIKMSSAVGT